MTEPPGNCPTCGREVASRYCPDCGERQLRPHDLTLGHLVGQAIETISNTDGRVFGSVRDLAIRPGALTAAYLGGRRKPYSALLIVAAVGTRGLGLSGSALDGWLSLLHLAIYTAYLYLAVGTAYGVTGVARALKVVALAAAVPVILIGYRFAIFLITLYTT